MDNDTKITLSEFAQKAIQRLQDKKVIKHRKLYVPTLKQEITIRNLSYAEIVECTKADNDSDDNYIDKYSVYLAVIEPNLKQTATELKASDAITEYIEVVDIFDLCEINQISTEIMKLSGAMADEKVSIVDDLKN